jgi:hypothetical protein
MTDQHAPNDASRKSQAEGDRPIDRDEQAGGITNRPLEEEKENQDAVPDRGKARPGAHAGHGDTTKERTP